MPQAPSASCRAASAGDMCVLPCGANSTPAARQNSIMVAEFDRSAESRSTISGGTKPAENKFGRAATNSAIVVPAGSTGAPFTCQSSSVMRLIQSHGADLGRLDPVDPGWTVRIRPVVAGHVPAGAAVARAQPAHVGHTGPAHVDRLPGGARGRAVGDRTDQRRVRSAPAAAGR